MDIATSNAIYKKRNLILVTFVLVILTLAAYINYDYTQRISVLKNEYINACQREVDVVANKIDLRFKYLYQAIRTMSFLPGIKNLDYYGKNFSPEAKESVQQIYNNAYYNVKMSEIYFLRDSINPDKIDKKTGKLEIPILTFDEFLIQPADTKVDTKASPGTQASTAPQASVPVEQKNDALPEEEIYEYRQMKKQLEFLKENFSSRASFSEINVPVVSGEQVITCDVTEFSLADLKKGDDTHRNGVVFTVPVYNSQGVFRGGVSAVLRSDIIRSDLPESGFIVLSANTPENVFVNNTNAEWKKSIEYFTKGQGNPNRIFSTVQPLKFDDKFIKWNLWVDFPDTLFWDSHDVLQAKKIFFLSLLSVFSLGMVISYVIFTSFNNQIILEKRVAERTEELENERRSVKLLLDNSENGFMSFNSKGVINPSFSSAIENMFGCKPAGLHVSELINSKNTDWSSTIDILFSEAIPFESMVETCPKLLIVDNKRIAIKYRAVRNNEHAVQDVMVVTSDISELHKLEQLNEEERQTNKAILKILNSKSDFLEIFEILTRIKENLHDETACKRLLHTVKGGLAFLECREMAEAVHHLESNLKENQGPTFYAKAVDDIFLMMNQFIEKHDRVLKIKGENKTLSVDYSNYNGFLQAIENNASHDEILEKALSLKEQPISEALSWLNDILDQSSGQLGKEVNKIKWEGKVLIDPDLHRPLFKSFIHFARNIADHGIEDPDTREMIGKPRAGTMIISCKENKNMIEIRFKDDGAGIDVEKVKNKAKELGIPIPKDEGAICNLIFLPSFTTKDNVTELSGRGIGLNAISFEAQALGGDAKVINHFGQGTEFVVTFEKVRG